MQTRQIISVFIIAAAVAFPSSAAATRAKGAESDVYDCARIADLAVNAAKLRDAGVSLQAVEKHLRRDVSKQDELDLALTVVRLIYRVKEDPETIRKAVLRKCG